METRPYKHLITDSAGAASPRLLLGASLVALAVAMTAPADHAIPAVAKVAGKFRAVLIEPLEKVTNTLGGL